MRKVKNRAFEEGEGNKLPSNVDVKKYCSSILKLRQELKNYSSQKRAEIKEAYDVADANGVDRKLLKQTVKIIEAQDNFVGEEKMMINYYLESSGQYAFFAINDSEEEAA